MASPSLGEETRLSDVLFDLKEESPPCAPLGDGVSAEPGVEEAHSAGRGRWPRPLCVAGTLDYREEVRTGVREEGEPGIHIQGRRPPQPWPHCPPSSAQLHAVCPSPDR